MQKCQVCGQADFYKESGFFFCSTCQTQNEEIREEILEVRIDTSTKLRKRRICRIRSDKTDERLGLGWTSWELYNFVLIGLTNELIELGAPSDIKVTVLQLWARYLGKLEIAFTSTKKKLIPKLARRYKKRDAEIIYGKVLSQNRAKKRKRSGSSITDSRTSTYQSEGSLKEFNRNKRLMITADYDRFIQSQTSSEGDALSATPSAYSMQSSTAQSFKNDIRIQFTSSAKKEIKKIKNMAKKLPRHKRNKYRQSHVTTQYKLGLDIITPMRLWAILYLALRIHNHSIHLGDMLRYGREGHLSYYKLDHLIPPEITLTRSNQNLLSRVTDITHKGMRRTIGSMAKFLGVTKIICPDLSSLISRYCVELELPEGISLYGKRFIALSPPKMKFDKKSSIPNYEGRAMAFIIVILKTLLALDGVTEYEISNVAEKINSAISDEGISNRRLFSFREWQRYIECRRTVLINTHFPTRIKYDSNIPDVNSLYIKFMESMHSKADGREVPEITTHKHLISRNIIDAMKQCITNVNYIDLSLEDVNIFTASLTPHHSYLQELLRHPRYDDIPSMLRNNFSSTKIRFMTNSQCAYELALQYNITLNFTDSNLHFIEKIVPFFEQTRISSVKELKDKIVVYDLIEVEIEGDKKEDFINYVHRKIPCRFKIDMKKKQYHDNMRMTNANAKAPALVSSDEFIFDEISSNGKLLIPDSDNKDNESDEDDCSGDNFSEEARSLLFKFSEMCNINLSKTEKKAMFTNMSWKRKQKSKSLRNAQGKFIKRNVSSTQQHDIENSNEIHRTEQFDIPVENFEIEDLLPEITEICNSNNTRICSNTTQYACDDHFESCGKFKPKTDKFLCTSDVETNNTLRLFRPFKDYWTYHCNFGRVKPKNFELFEKMLPKSFQWLLNECASVIEMPTEDLYEEVCLIETYYANISEQAGVHTSNTDIESHNQMYINAALNKW